uniref:Uncharacterized protein n=1 Tax=Timema douglasi TaxID=61478 RepID=A0A7R8VQF7_TIMDO|nr:unnamed protein product [Timema douglasi]
MGCLLRATGVALVLGFSQLGVILGDLALVLQLNISCVFLETILALLIIAENAKLRTNTHCSWRLLDVISVPPCISGEQRVLWLWFEKIENVNNAATIVVVLVQVVLVDMELVEAGELK